MKLIKVGAAVLNQTPRDWKGNLANILVAIEQARLANVTVLCLPEATITGYGLEDDYFCADVPRRAILKLGQIATHTHNMIVCVGLPIRFDNSLYNTIATIVHGRVVGFTCKQHLAGDGIHYENRWFKPWPQGVVQNINIPELRLNMSTDPHKELYVDSGNFPIGDVHFNVGGVKIGYEICEDAWVAGRPGTVLASKGIDIYLNPSASHFSFGKLETRRNFVIDGSRAFNATYIYTNLVGNEAGRAIYDGGALIASGGKLLAIGKRFTYQNVLLTTAVVNVDTTRTSSVRTASFQPNISDFNKGCVNVDFIYPENITERTPDFQQERWETDPNVKHEECTRAVGLALMDYMRKSHTKGFVISLSGGADSGMVTYLCAKGIELGIDELGHEAFTKKFCPHLDYIPNKSNYWLLSKLITTAYQPTAQSGEVTRNAARELARVLEVPHFLFNVEPMFQEYLKLGANINHNEPLTFKDNGLVLQNLQARVRAPSIWMVANFENKLLLTTSNMSEAAVGYATMDGDTAGCVAPISGLSKVYIREYLNWAKEVFPILSHITQQEPTAELLPVEYNQTDEKDLMPYWLLHMIEGLVVKNRCTPVEIFQELSMTSGLDSHKLIDYIKKFFKLFSINQWKRERYALGFHLDDHNLDPRTWCRMPILSGGYEEELAELEALKK